MDFFRKYISGGIEVPVSNEHPWGVNHGLKMPIPLDFANELRKDGSRLNIEYRKFLGYKLYQLIPIFINYDAGSLTSRISFYAKYDQFINNVFSGKKQISKKIKMAEITKMGPTYINMLARKKLYERAIESANTVKRRLEKEKENNKSPKNLEEIEKNIKEKEEQIEQLQTSIKKLEESKVWEIFYSRSPAYKLYPNYIIDNLEMINSLLGSLKFNNNYDYVDNKFLTTLLNHNRALLKGSSPDPKHFLELTETVELNNIESLADIDITNEFTIVPCGIFSDTAGHAVTIIIDHIKKVFYIMDSNGTHPYYSNIISFVMRKLEQIEKTDESKRELCSTLKKYDSRILLPISGGPSFQAITKDSFCQTWTIFISLLFIINHKTIPDDADINEIIYGEIIKYAKPLVGYSEQMSSGTKLGLILIEFMYYIYSCYREDISEFIISDTNELKQDIEIVESVIVKYMKENNIPETNIEEYERLKKIFINVRSEQLEKKMKEYENYMARYQTPVANDLISNIVKMDLPPKNIRDVALDIKNNTL